MTKFSFSFPSFGGTPNFYDFVALDESQKQPGMAEAEKFISDYAAAYKEIHLRHHAGLKPVFGLAPDKDPKWIAAKAATTEDMAAVGMEESKSEDGLSGKISYQYGKLEWALASWGMAGPNNTDGDCHWFKIYLTLHK